MYLNTIHVFIIDYFNTIHVISNLVQLQYKFRI